MLARICNGATVAVLTIADGGDRAVFSLDGDAPEMVDLGQIAFDAPSMSLSVDGPATPGVAVSEQPLATFLHGNTGRTTYVDHDGDLIPDVMDRDDDNDGIDDAHDAAPLTYEAYPLDLLACPTAQTSGGLTLFDARETIVRAMGLTVRNVLVADLLFDRLGMTEFSRIADSLPIRFGDLGSGGAIPTNEDIDRLLLGGLHEPDGVPVDDTGAVQLLTRSVTGTLRTFAGLLGYVENQPFENVTSQPNYQIPKRLNDPTNNTGTVNFHNGSGDSVQTAERNQEAIDYYRDIARFLRGLGIQSIDDPDDPTKEDAAVAEIAGFLNPANYATPGEFLSAYGRLQEEIDVCASYTEQGSRWAGLLSTPD